MLISVNRKIAGMAIADSFSTAIEEENRLCIVPDFTQAKTGGCLHCRS